MRICMAANYMTSSSTAASTIAAVLATSYSVMQIPIQVLLVAQSVRRISR